MSRLEEAKDFCIEVLAELDRTTDIEEKIILLNVLSARLNQWTLETRLEIIQEKSRELAKSNT